MGVSVTICVTCSSAGENGRASGERTDGEQLAATLEEAASNQSDAPRIIRHACLWACREACTVLIRGGGRTAYLAGRFTPDAPSAAAILGWCAAYEQSPDGTVPYKLWPDAMKGHFIARIPFAEEA